VEKQVEAHIPTKYGDFDIIIYADSPDDHMPTLVFRHRDIDLSKPVTVRIHSECLTGDIFGSKRCDCGTQLNESLRIINEQRGILIYLRQEGRGIGIINKMKAYNLQDNGLDTVDANIHLGFQPDERHYELAVTILKSMGIDSINIITNNPEKIEAIEHSDIKLISRIPLIIPPESENKNYLEVKKDKMGHLM
jgi:3,4-dihydroxy 2-butanone 4-phosphate synthase/GTP cyclohydrolase II